MFSPKNLSCAVQPWEYLPAAAGTYKAGQLLNANGGTLKPVSDASNTTPGYLCMADITVAEGEVIPVARVKKDAIYMTQLSVAAEGADIGSMLRVSAGGLQVDSGAAGTFELTDLEGTDAGCEVSGRFH